MLYTVDNFPCFIHEDEKITSTIKSIERFES